MDAAQRRKRDGILQVADQPRGRIGQPGRNLSQPLPSSPLIVTAGLAPADLAWFDRLRRHYFPPERNQLAAHLTLFHALPPSVEAEAAQLLAALAREARPAAMVAGLIHLGRGVAYRILSDDLEAIREHIAGRFHGSLSAQDAGGWRAHVTVQNKVAPMVAKQTLSELERDFVPRPVGIAALELHRYLGGLWEPIGRWPFRGY